MSIPNMLAEPPVVVQTAQTCWAAAFESWADATATLQGTNNTLTSQRLIDLFGGDSQLTQPTGRATPDGIMLMAGMGLMQLFPFRPSRLTIALLGRALDLGYVYVIYFRVGHPAHAIVLYGVDARNIYVMDPMPGRGLITLAPNYFMTLSDARVLLGFSLGLALSRSVSASLAPLLSPGS